MTEHTTSDGTHSKMKYFTHPIFLAKINGRIFSSNSRICQNGGALQYTTDQTLYSALCTLYTYVSSILGLSRVAILNFKTLYFTFCRVRNSFFVFFLRIARFLTTRANRSFTLYKRANRIAIFVQSNESESLSLLFSSERQEQFALSLLCSNM